MAQSLDVPLPFGAWFTIRSRTSSYCCLTVNFSGLLQQQCDSRRIPTDRLSKSSTNNCIVQQFACFFCYSMYFLGFRRKIRVRGLAVRRRRRSARAFGRVAVRRGGAAANCAVRRTAKYTRVSRNPRQERFRIKDGRGDGALKIGDLLIASKVPQASDLAQSQDQPRNRFTAAAFNRAALVFLLRASAIHASMIALGLASVGVTFWPRKR